MCKTESFSKLKLKTYEFNYKFLDKIIYLYY